MSQVDEIVVFGVASSGVVDQWDGHLTPIGILLHWFTRPELGYPDLGFDIYRAQVPDVPPLPFNDLNVPLIEGKQSWTYANVITLSRPGGLHFERSEQIGWWRLVVSASSDPVTVRFTSPAWLININADAGTSDLTVVGKSANVEVRRESLYRPGASISWRTRGIQELEISGDGSISLIGFHLINDESSWQHLAHRCLPVIDPLYTCGPQPIGSEADEAQSRLPVKVAAEWSTRFSDSFNRLLPALRRLAIRESPAEIPCSQGNPEIRLNSNEQAIIALSSLDPHGSRILGLAFDDPLGGALDGHEYSYKVVGRWFGNVVKVDLSGGRIDLRMLRSKYGLAIDFGRGGQSSDIIIRFSSPVFNFSLQIDPIAPVVWVAENGTGASDSGSIKRSTQLSLPQLQELRLTLTSSGQANLLANMSWTPVVERFGLLPGIVAVDNGPPLGPAFLSVAVIQGDSPSAITTADLDWPIKINADDSIPEGGPISYQIGHRSLNTDPAIAVSNPVTILATDLLHNGDPIFVPSARARETLGQRVLYSDRNEGVGLSPGRWAWWIRGVDLFGRVSTPSPWVQAAVVDTAPPPAPIMIEAEWVQRNIPETTIGVLGRSTEGERWLQSSSANAGLIASWTYGPDQTELRPDVDGFRLYIRLPISLPSAPVGAELQYSDAWPAPIANLGPMKIRSDGVVSSAPSMNPSFALTLLDIQQLPATPNAKETDPVRSSCVTDLTLDGASGIFVGGTLTIGTSDFPVVANGDGTNLMVVVQHMTGSGPIAGNARLSSVATIQLAEITTNLPAITPPTGLRVRSGVLVIGSSTSSRRLIILRNSGGVFLCRTDGAVITIGDTATWFPVWSVSLDDAGFGPATSDTVPVAHAQVAVSAVRKIQGGGLASTPSASLTITAVDLTTPSQPAMDPIAFNPGDTCAQLASRADWYGKSRFQLSWAAQTNRSFTVYRALGDEINRLDRLELNKLGRRAQNFPQAADWPLGVYADNSRRLRVITELDSISTAQAIANVDDRAAALDVAYEAMTVDTQMMLARQDYAWPAFVALFGDPIHENSFEDVLDGYSSGHWFYRVTSRTAAGMESTPCEPTPPICCPDVVPPAIPVAHMALADDGAVKLRWLASPDADLDHYDIFTAREPEAIAELALMPRVAINTPSAPQGGVVIEQVISRPTGEWCFWIVAVDKAGNRSAPSKMLRGKSLRPIPNPPEWVSAERTPAGSPKAIRLVWRHVSDQRLACLIERRIAGGSLWVAVSPWLPRSVYSLLDLPPDISSAWEYRVRVRDQDGQTAGELPVIAVSALN